MLCHEVPCRRFRPVKKSRRRVGKYPGLNLEAIEGFFSEFTANFLRLTFETFRDSFCLGTFRARFY